MRTVVLVSVLLLVLGACGGGGAAGESDAATARAASTTPGQPIVILLRLEIADEAGADIVATGEVLEGSTLGDKPFCVAGTTGDRHANEDPTMEPYGLLARTFTCPDGTVKMAFTPEVEQAQSLTQGGSWTIVSGTGAFDGLRGSGEMEVTYGPDPDAPTNEKLTGTAMR